MLQGALRDIGENILLCAAPDWSALPLKDKALWLRERPPPPQANPGKGEEMEGRAQTIHQHGEICNNPPAHRTTRSESAKMVAGSGLLQLSKSPIKGLAAIAFKLQSITTAAR